MVGLNLQDVMCCTASTFLSLGKMMWQDLDIALPFLDLKKKSFSSLQIRGQDCPTVDKNLSLKTQLRKILSRVGKVCVAECSYIRVRRCPVFGIT